MEEACTLLALRVALEQSVAVVGYKQRHAMANACYVAGAVAELGYAEEMGWIPHILNLRSPHYGLNRGVLALESHDGQEMLVEMTRLGKSHWRVTNVDYRNLPTPLWASPIHAIG